MFDQRNVRKSKESEESCEKQRVCMCGINRKRYQYRTNPSGDLLENESLTSMLKYKPKILKENIEISRRNL